MTTATQRRLHTPAPTHGSRTITLHDTEPRPSDDAAPSDGAGPSAEPNATVGVLRLRGARQRAHQCVAWGADVIDNEGCGKKKSKICCIYHKPRLFNESSSDSESASGSDSHSDDDGARHHGSDLARPTRRYRHPSRRHGCGHNTARREGTVHELDQPDSDSDADANVYERAPKRKC